jgi:hypothetical protein
LPWIGVALALAFGAWLRLAFPLDIEWKADEAWSFAHAQAMVAGGAWPPLGMPTSIATPNPGLSAWVFGALTWLSGAKTPPDLARAVALCNIAALAALVAFAVVCVDRARREPWLWAAALVAVNPLAMIFERKIWPPSVLPLPAAALLWAWWNRRLWPLALLWGALGALIGQIEESAWFFALAIAAWTWVRDRAAFPWAPWLAGSMLGALPALPWALDTLHSGVTPLHALRLPIMAFYLRWLTQPFGFGLDYSLGHSFGAFLAWPMVGGQATWLMAAAHALLAAIFAWLLLLALRRLARNRPPAGDVLLGVSPETTLLAAALWGYGLSLSLITVFGPDSHRHYLIVVAPLMGLCLAMTMLWAAPSVRQARLLLAALCLCQAALSAGALTYIDHKGVVDATFGRFGVTWEAQTSG